MAEFFLGIIIISAIAAFLALLLELADRYLADYGEKNILVNEEKKMVVTAGRPLLATLAEHRIFLPSACGGKGTCGYCKVKVLKGGGQVLPTETPYLTVNEMYQQVRIACQLKVKEDLEIQISEALLFVKEYRIQTERTETISP